MLKCLYLYLCYLNIPWILPQLKLGVLPTCFPCLQLKLKPWFLQQNRWHFPALPSSCSFCSHGWTPCGYIQCCECYWAVVTLLQCCLIPSFLSCVCASKLYSHSYFTLKGTCTWCGWKWGKVDLDLVTHLLFSPTEIQPHICSDLEPTIFVP